MSEYNIQMNKYNALNVEYDQLYPATKIENVDGLNTALQKKEDSFSVLPLNKGGTGVQSLTALRSKVGIGFAVGCGAGSSVNIALPDNGTYLICSNDNARQGAILVQAGSAYGKIARIISLSTPTGWSYAQGNNVLTLSETGGEYGAEFWVTSFGMYAYSGG